MGEGYDKMLSDLNAAYQSFPWNLVEDEQLKYLVKNRVIQMTEGNLKALREKGDFELFLSWVKNDFMAYYKLVEEEELQDEDELHRLIDVEELSDDQRSMLVALAKQEAYLAAMEGRRVKVEADEYVVWPKRANK